MTEAETVQLEERIVELAPRFELPALIDALCLLGYDGETVIFRSCPTLAHTAALVRAVKFQRTPRRAVVEVNIGLMGSQGPLPMYFWELLCEQRDDDMTELVWFFDQLLLAQRFAAEHPERDRRSLPKWEQTRRTLLLLARLPSPSGIHWLMTQFFPELEVRVQRTTGERTLRTREFDIGGAEMGNGCTLGGIGHLPVGGVEVRLICSEEEPRDAALWIEAAQRRLLQLALPILIEQNPYQFLRVFLVLRQAVGTVQLSRDRYLGVNRVDQSGTRRQSVEELLLWSGEVRNAVASEKLNYQLPPGVMSAPKGRSIAQARGAQPRKE